MSDKYLIGRKEKDLYDARLNLIGVCYSFKSNL